MKKFFFAVFLVSAFLFCSELWAQQEPNLDMFYGKKDTGGAKFGGEYCLTNTNVYLGFADFYYLTKGKKSNYTDKWPYYYGVELEGAYAQGKDYHFAGKGDADFNAWWGLLWIDGRLYANDSSKVRPYVDAAVGIGTGQIYATGPKSSVLDFDKSLNLVRLKGGAGVAFMLSDKYSLDVGVGADGTIAYLGTMFSNSNITLAGVQATVGISRWNER
jgi:hypothetical protein